MLLWFVKFMSIRRESGKLKVGDLASKMAGLKVVGENLTEEERASFIQDLYENSDDEVDFEMFLKVWFILPLFLWALSQTSLILVVKKILLKILFV